MKIATAEEVNHYLSQLAGGCLSIARNAGSMKLFGFGELRSTETGEYFSEWALHVSSPWRLSVDGRIITGTEDYFIPGEPEAAPSVAECADSKTAQATLQQEKLRPLLGVGLTVVSVRISECNGLMLDLSTGLRLEIFPCSSVEEHWRLFRPGFETNHLVAEANSLHLE